MRIVLTGVTGQIGRALIVPLGELGAVVLADRAKLDLSEPDSIAAALDRLVPDLIVNPAAYTSVDRAEGERDLAFTVNARAPEVIAEWAARRDVPLVHFSTDYVFDGKGDIPWREDSRPNPLSVYGASKLAGEQAIKAANGPHLIVRTSWVYAAYGTNFLRTIARLAREKSELRIVADQIGAPTPARVIAVALLGVLRGNSALKNRFAAAAGMVNVTASGEASWHGFATRIIDGLRARGLKLSVQAVLPIRSDEFPTNAERPRNSRLDLRLLREEFGINPPQWSHALEPELDELASLIE
jgi:dTDP-4-dehydrorhamnose reductase